MATKAEILAEVASKAQFGWSKLLAVVYGLWIGGWLQFTFAENFHSYRLAHRRDGEVVDGNSAS